LAPNLLGSVMKPIPWKVKPLCFKNSLFCHIYLYLPVMSVYPWLFC
jgi:hypothetical protein